MSDLELLKVYLQEQIDTTGNKKFVFKECNAIEFRLTDVINEINELEEKHKEIERLNNIIEELKELNKKYSQQLDDYWNRIEKAIETIDIYGTSSWETADKLYSILRGDKE